MANSTSLIAYFSRKGNNYVGGSIVKLPIGNTEVIAEKIQALTGSDMFQIETEKSYPEDYTETTNIAQEEKKKNARPKLTARVTDLESYDVIYLGYPNWWGTMPMAVFTFLEAYDFSGKTIVPYCTHEGSGMGSSERDIKKFCPNAKVLPGLAVRGGNVDSADKDLANWLKKLNLNNK
ncbi:flavodoxin/nitric oxide synthase [Lucifera butyrica]|uniref:Flavodoxin/nitric oxide synthase n=1 Tax=Lucifera butyrica TaxID=1351585 RepID=A0A498QXS7_9FIRM|nr:flavodoxin [Lucifera butyrica]VBB04956.1 flavodoxin/nitric oxide synthase [Lucifera butyrica]